MVDVRERAAAQVVEDDDLMSGGDKGIDEMAAEKSRAARNERFHAVHSCTAISARKYSIACKRPSSRSTVGSQPSRPRAFEMSGRRRCGPPPPASSANTIRELDPANRRI